MSEKVRCQYVGLSAEEVLKSRLQYGENRLTPPQRPSVWKLYWEKFNDPIIRILLFAAVLSLVIGIYEQEYVETIGILVAIFLATGIGFAFEWDAMRKFDILNALGQEDPVTVIRSGKACQIPCSQVVVGDIVVLQQGDEVPADLCIEESMNLIVDESSLTGEPSACKYAETAVPADLEPATFPAYRLYRSSKVLEGNAICRVMAVGDATEIKDVAQGATRETGVETPLEKQLNLLGQKITKYSIIVAALVFVVFTTHGIYSYVSLLAPGAAVDVWKICEIGLRYFMVAVTLIVMAVPEGLPMAVTLSLALNMRRMLVTNNLVRKMHACETMGAVTVVCTDKTGTLTRNRMQVTDICGPDVGSQRLLQNMAVNSTALLGEDGERLGNPTECALLQYVKEHGGDYGQMREEAEVLDRIPFSTERKLMATLVKTSQQDLYLFVKGAPEYVMAMCRIDDRQKEEITACMKSYQQSAMRTLALACKKVETQDKVSLEEMLSAQDFGFQALAGIMDPVRKEVPGAVGICSQAGIGVKIVTGDNEGTAIEIARRIGIWKETDEVSVHAITGQRMGEMTDEELQAHLKDLKVISRSRPADKQRLVHLLQQQGEVVAVTGDGTNDAPALNQAQVGLAMGSGSAVAKEAGDIILLDDSFSSIATAVMWGRSLYKNIQRFIAFQLTICLAALILSAICAFMGMEMPFTVTQILWINLIMDTMASLAISTLPPSSHVMGERPRKVSDFIVSSSMRYFIGGYAFLFLAVLTGMYLYFDRWHSGFAGMATTRELTICFTMFVLMQFWNLLNTRALFTGKSAFSRMADIKPLLAVMGIILVGQIAIVQYGGEVFRTEPLSLSTWLWLLGTSSIVLWIGEAVRGIQRLCKK